MPREIITLQVGQCGNQSEWLWGNGESRALSRRLLQGKWITRHFVEGQKIQNSQDKIQSLPFLDLSAVAVTPLLYST